MGDAGVLDATSADGLNRRLLRLFRTLLFVSNAVIRQCSAAWEFSFFTSGRNQTGIVPVARFPRGRDRWLKRGGEAPGGSSSQSGTIVDPD